MSKTKCEAKGRNCSWLKFDPKALLLDVHSHSLLFARFYNGMVHNNTFSVKQFSNGSVYKAKGCGMGFET